LQPTTRMNQQFWRLVLPVALVASACGGGTPSAPSSLSDGAGSSPARSVDGATVSAIDGQAIPRITVRIGDRTVMSDAAGAFHVENMSDGFLPAVLTGPSVVERRMMIAPSAQPLRASLIPAAFDLVAFDEMFRGTEQLQRWTSAPSLVVLTTVMNYETGFGDQDDYHATSEQLTDAETTLLIDQLTEGLTALTGNTFTAFASVGRESAASGAKVTTLRQGKIVVGRYKGLRTLGNTIGKGRWASDLHGQVTGGVIFLDREFDKSDQRRLLRIHELGHALGYLHVTSRSSIMNPAIGPDVSIFDREGALIAFQRQPGNLSPDADPTAETPRGGGIFGIAPGSFRTVWAAPVVCGVGQ
jgi:hypothetical protein